MIQILMTFAGFQEYDYLIEVYDICITAHFFDDGDGVDHATATTTADDKAAD